MARPPKCRMICSKPETTRFTPDSKGDQQPIILGYDEYETVRLLDFLQLSQAQCAARMQVSRPTVTRMYESARKKIAQALVNAQPLFIDGGDVVVCSRPKPECSDSPHCCHRARTGCQSGRRKEE